MSPHAAGRGLTLGIAVAVVGAILTAAPAHAADDWIQQGAAINGEPAGGISGYSVAMSADGNTVAVGAPYSNSFSGQVRVFDFDGSGWIQRGLDIDGGAYDQLGVSVAMSADGNTIAIGAPSYDTNDHDDAGQVGIYRWDGSSWILQASIDGQGDEDYSGSSVALSADGAAVAIGAPYSDASASDAGQVRVYTSSGATWIQRGDPINGTARDDSSGYSVSLSADGGAVAIGSPYFNTSDDDDAGQVRVFDFDGSAWIQRGNSINGENTDDDSGYAVALSADGSTVAIGAPLSDDNDTNTGQVRVFTWNGSAWIQRGNSINGENADDRSGYSVAMSADGSIVAIGAIYNDDAGANAGQVRVHTMVGDTWIQRGSNLSGQAAGDVFGWSVAMSADGATVAGGAPNNDANGVDAGQVRVYNWPTSGVISGPVTYFSFVHADGRECTAISPQQVQVGTMVELPGVDALCQTMPGSTVAGWTIPVPEGFTGYGSSIEPFPPGLMVRVIESQTFTLVPFEPILQIDYDTNIARDHTCTPADLAHTSDDGRIAHVWVPRIDFAMARTPSQAPCTPDGHELVGWNTAGDGTGESIEPGAPLPDGWADGPDNQQHLYAVWTPTP